jgi:hypothetical protein
MACYAQTTGHYQHAGGAVLPKGKEITYRSQYFPYRVSWQDNEQILLGDRVVNAAVVVYPFWVVNVE